MMVAMFLVFAITLMIHFTLPSKTFIDGKSLQKVDLCCWVYIYFHFHNYFTFVVLYP